MPWPTTAISFALDAARWFAAEARNSNPKLAPTSSGVERRRASRAQLQIVLPVTFILIVVLSDPIGGVLAMAITGTPFSVSSGIVFIALFRRLRSNGRGVHFLCE
jgi:hypothetical protein